MKIMSVVGARPNFMKVAPLIAAIRRDNARRSSIAVDNYEPGGQRIDHILVHTGQHYDQLMSDSFFADLGLPKPNAHLGVGSGTHAKQMADIMKKFEDVLLHEKPDVLVVVGDVNSTIACALVAAKVSYDGAAGRPLIAHVEAGLRSFDRTMPEEINRIVTDQLSDLLFVTEKGAISNLVNEGISANNIYFVGNTMIDSLLAHKEKATLSPILDNLGLRQPRVTGPSAVTRYALLTLHRPANVDCRNSFFSILEGLNELLEHSVVVFPAHPRTCKRIRDFGLEGYFDWTHVKSGPASISSATAFGRILVTDPLSYIDFLCLMRTAALVITDSGGIQEETTCLGIPCVTVRENTERPVTIESGTNVLAGVATEGIRAAIRRQSASGLSGSMPELWDGEAASRILDVLKDEFQSRAAGCGAVARVSPSYSLGGRL